MSYILFPSLLALGIKLGIFYVSKGEIFRRNPLLAFFLIALFGLNIAELLILMNVSNGAEALPLMMAYYVAAVYSAAALFMLAARQVIGWHFTNKVVFALATLVATLTCVPGLFIAGAESIGYSLIRVPGPYYAVLQSFLLGSLMGAVLLMFRGIMKGRTNLDERRSFALLVSTAPLALVSIGVILMMMAGYRFNATVIVSLMTTITLVALIYTETRYRLFLFLSYVPFTREHQIRAKVAGLVHEAVESLFSSEGDMDMKTISHRFETAMIELAIEATGGNKTHAAELLQIGKATLHRKLSKAA